jgi:hypothetical protein
VGDHPLDPSLGRCFPRVLAERNDIVPLVLTDIPEVRRVRPLFGPANNDRGPTAVLVPAILDLLERQEVPYGKIHAILHGKIHIFLTTGEPVL